MACQRWFTDETPSAREMVDSLMRPQMSPEGRGESFERIFVGPEDIPLFSRTSVQIITTSTEYCHHVVERSILRTMITTQLTNTPAIIIAHMLLPNPLITTCV